MLLGPLTLLVTLSVLSAVPGLAVRARKVEPGKRPQPPVSEASPPSLDENNFLHRTWGFLRSSSDEVGSAAEDVLELEGRLAELQKDLGEQYKAWDETKTTLTKDNDRLRNSRAHLEGELQQQSNLHLELARQQDSLQQTKNALAWEAKSLEQTLAQWSSEKSLLEKSVADLEAQIEAVAEQQAAERKAAEAKALELRQFHTKQEALVYERNKKLLEQEGALSQLKIDMGEKHSALIQQNQASMDEIKRLQKDVAATAQVQHALLSLKARVGAQLDQKVQQEGMASDLERQCNEDANSLDEQIKGVNAQIQKFRQWLVDCQALDGENQRLQAKVNACKAAQLR